MDESLVTSDIPGAAASAALTELLAGNRRFISGEREHPHQDVDRRAELAAGQKPFALVFGCSDSRVAAEHIFDRGLGDLFVVRTAGHVVDNGVLGSIEFGVEVLEIPLIVVLGHDSCGAVKATLSAYESGETPGGYLRDIVGLVTPSVVAGLHKGVKDVDGLVAEHAVATVDLLTSRSVAVAKAVQEGRVGIVAMEYALADGEVSVLSAVPAELSPAQ